METQSGSAGIEVSAVYIIIFLTVYICGMRHFIAESTIFFTCISTNTFQIRSVHTSKEKTCTDGASVDPDIVPSSQEAQDNSRSTIMGVSLSGKPPPLADSSQSHTGENTSGEKEVKARVFSSPQQEINAVGRTSETPQLHDLSGSNYSDEMPNFSVLIYLICLQMLRAFLPLLYFAVYNADAMLSVALPTLHNGTCN